MLALFLRETRCRKRSLLHLLLQRKHYLSIAGCSYRPMSDTLHLNGTPVENAQDGSAGRPGDTLSMLVQDREVRYNDCKHSRGASRSENSCSSGKAGGAGHV